MDVISVKLQRLLWLSPSHLLRLLHLPKSRSFVPFRSRTTSKCHTPFRWTRRPNSYSGSKSSPNSSSPKSSSLIFLSADVLGLSEGGTIPVMARQSTTPLDVDVVGRGEPRRSHFCTHPNPLACSSIRIFHLFRRWIVPDWTDQTFLRVLPTRGCFSFELGKFAVELDSMEWNLLTW